MGETRLAYRIVVRIPKEKGPIGKIGTGWRIMLKRILKKRCEDVDWTHLAHSTVQ
jgi:hypothetical protein